MYFVCVHTYIRLYCRCVQCVFMYRLIIIPIYKWQMAWCWQSVNCRWSKKCETITYIHTYVEHAILFIIDYWYRREYSVMWMINWISLGRIPLFGWTYLFQPFRMSLLMSMSIFFINFSLTEDYFDSLTYSLLLSISHRKFLSFI